MGFSHVESRATVDSARTFLEQALDKHQPLPDLIMLDLDLGMESGYEILRIRYADLRLSAIPIVVWTHLGEENCEVCALFNVDGYVSKWEGPTVLRDVLAKIRRYS